MLLRSPRPRAVGWADLLRGCYLSPCGQLCPEKSRKHKVPGTFRRFGYFLEATSGSPDSEYAVAGMRALQGTQEERKAQQGLPLHDCN